MIIVSGGIKGGSGKTTVALNLAIMRARSGKQLILIDADSADNANASDFSEYRDSIVEGGKGFDAARVNGKSVITNVPGLAKRYDDTIIDVGGADSISQRSALAIADLLILPVYPSSLDIWVIGNVQRVVEEAKAVNPKLRAFGFLMRADSTGTSNEEAAEILRNVEGIEFHGTPIVNRKAFRVAAAQGLSVTELRPKDQKAIDEITALYERVFGEAPTNV